MKRLYVDDGVFAIARDGYDAETDTNPRHMKIDTRQGPYFGVFMQGSVPMASMVLRSGAASVRTYWSDIPFGKTFEKPPAVITMYRGAHIVGASPVFHIFTSSGSVISYAYPYVDRIRFITVVIPSPSYLAGPTAISYIVAHS